MPEPVEQWWARRQWSKGVPVPYPIGSFRADWEHYPVLVRQFHPDLNGGVTLTQVPPAADVWLLWVCDSGHRFIATPAEQRQRPDGSRRRSTWCPECTRLALPSPVRWAPPPPSSTPSASSPAAEPPAPSVPSRPPRAAAPRATLACGHPPSSARRRSDDRQSDGCRICRNARAGADAVAVGDAFVSRWAPATASRAEADLRARLRERFELDLAENAVKVARPFFEHVEVWPDIPFADLRVAIEYDTTGREGLEHVGRRETVDRRKDALLRQAGWEVVRIRCGRLPALGPYDVLAAGVSGAVVDRVVDRFREIRGHLLVDAYLRDAFR